MLNTKYTQIEHEETNSTVMVPPDFYFWITENDKSIYYQNGEFYEGEDLPAMKWQDVPEFFWRIVKKSYPQSVIEREKLVFPEDRKATMEEIRQVKTEKAEALWKCDEDGCGEEMPFKRKGVHIATHASSRKAEQKRTQKLAQV